MRFFEKLKKLSDRIGMVCIPRSYETLRKSGYGARASNHAMMKFQDFREFQPRNIVDHLQESLIIRGIAVLRKVLSKL